MPTFITNGNAKESLTGSTEKRFDVAPNGTLWAAVVATGNPGKIKFFRSTNGGSTWTYASGSDVSLGQTGANVSFFIDADGYAHCSWVQWATDPQLVKYARGTPTTGGGWSWSTLSLAPAGGRLRTDSDIVAHRSGTGWIAWLTWAYSSTTGQEVSRIGITAAGALSVTTLQTGPTTGGQLTQFGSLEWNHTGDGRTRVADPHLFLTVGSQSNLAPLYVYRATYSAGNWTWGSPVTVSASLQFPDTVLTSAFDGTRLMVAYAANSATISVVEWDGVAGAVTARNPPAAPGGTGTVMGVSLSVDPLLKDVYLAWYDATDGDIRWSKFTRATLTWSAWSILVSRTANSAYVDGKIQLVKHPNIDAVDGIYVTGATSYTTQPVWSHRIVTLPRTPAAPTLGSPASGEKLDLANGGTFSWTYNGVALGDTQQAWSFRRKLGATTEYWNASAQTWGAVQVWNAGSTTTATFVADKWTNGNTYQWAVAVRSSSSGLDSVFTGDRSVIATSAPVVVVDAPNGIIYGEDTPLVGWTYTSLDPQASYRVKIIQEQAGIDPDVTAAAWDSGVTNSATARSIRVGTALSNGVAYRAYVQVTSSTAISSGWNYETFTISITPPSGPIVTPSAGAYGPTGVPRVTLALAATTSFLTQNQDVGPSVEWENDANTTVIFQDDDSTLQTTAGLRLTSLAAGTMRVVTNLGSPPAAPYGEPQPPGPLNFPVIAGRTYTGLAQIRAAATARSGRIKIRWYNNDEGTGTLISESSGTLVAVPNGAYAQAILTAVAPPLAKMARLVIEVTGPTAASEVFYVTRPSFHHGAGTAWTPGGYANLQTIRIERSIDGGLTWTTILERIKPNVYQEVVTYDRTMPFATALQYRAYSVIDLGDSSLTSSPGDVAATTANADLWTIRDPGDDLVEMNAYVVAHDRSDDEASSVNWVAGREYPIVDTEGIHAATGSLDIFSYNVDLADTLIVLRRTVPMVVQSPDGNTYYVRLLRRNYKIEAQRHRIISTAYIEIGDV